MLESNYHSPKFVLSNSNMNYKFISCYSVKQNFRRTREDNKASLIFLPEDVVPIILKFLILSDDTMIVKSIRLFYFLRLNFQSPKFKNYLLEERDDKFFRYSYILKRDDEIFIRYIAVQQTIEWNIESNSFKDIISYVEL